MFVDIVFIFGFAIGFSVAFYIRNRALGKKIDELLEKIKCPHEH